MSVKVMARVWAHSQTAGGELLVLLALADFANDAGECWPSIPVLARKARLTERQTRRVLTKLEEAGEIRKSQSTGGRNRRNHYFITLTENPDVITGKELQGKNNSVIGDTKTLTPMSGALNRHRTVNKRETESDKLIPDSLSHKRSRKLTCPDPAATDPRIKPFLSWFAEEYEKRFGAPYAIHWGKDGRRIKELSPAFDLPRLKDLATRFFESEDPWVRENGGFTIGVFMSQINKLASTANGNGHAEPAKVKDLGDGWLEVDGRRMDRATYERRYGQTER